jgi:hypothetical protein
MALVLAAVLIGFSVRDLLRARVIRGVEDEKFRRMLVLRKELELDT